MLDLEFRCSTKPGRSARKSNEDAILSPVYVNDFMLAGIADGLGGRPAGEIASKEVLDCARSIFESRPDSDFNSIFVEARRRIISLSESQPEFSGLASTMTLIKLNDCVAKTGHVGDCRIYHLRGNGIMRRTKDQTEVQRLIDEKILTKEMSKRYRRKNVLISAIQEDEEYTLQEETFSVEPGDRILLMTDGLYENIAMREIRDISVANSGVDEFENALISKVESRDPRDDYSIVVIDLMSCI